MSSEDMGDAWGTIGKTGGLFLTSIYTEPSERYHSLADALRDIATDLDVQTVRESYRRIMATEARQPEFFRVF